MDQWPKISICPQCDAAYQLSPSKMGRRTVCRRCGLSFHLLPDSSSDDTRLGPGGGGEATLPSVGRSWLDLRPGQMVAEQYLVIRPLGQGGLSRIFQVRDVESGRVLALKLPLPATVDSLPLPALVEEARAWLKPAPHPNLVTCEAVRVVMGLPAILLEYVSGGDLARLIGRGGGQLYQGGPEAALPKIMDIFIQVTRGLKYAHELGLSRLDIKPANILVGRGGRALLSDYAPMVDLAEAEPGESTLAPADGPAASAPDTSLPLIKPLIRIEKKAKTRAGRTELSGTRQYFSPEAALGLPGADRTADLWAAALTALECFFGRRLWEMGSTAGRAFEDHLKKPGKEPLVPIPEALTAFFRKAFAEQPQRRHLSAGEMEEELKKIFGEICGRPYGRPEAAAREENAERLKMKAETLEELRRILTAGERN